MSENPFAAAVTKEAQRLKRERQHTVYIYVRGCTTTRDCYCQATGGASHDEGDFPWVVDMDGNYERRGGRDRGKEQPLEYPFRKGESVEDYKERMVRREAWSEGFEEACEWMSNNPGPTGIPTDPPSNPHEGTSW